MQADRIVAPQLLQHVPVTARPVEIVFGMDFEPTDTGALFEKLPVMGRAQSHAYAQSMLL